MSPRYVSSENFLASQMKTINYFVSLKPYVIHILFVMCNRNRNVVDYVFLILWKNLYIYKAFALE